MSNTDKKDSVHPLVKMIKDEYQFTWKEFAEYLKERVNKDLQQVQNLSPANVRNFATDKSTAWWFWGQIGSIAKEMWLESRLKAKDDNELEQVDLYFSEMFSGDLMMVYAYYHSRKRNPANESSYLEALSIADTLANVVRSEVEQKFNIELPEV